MVPVITVKESDDLSLARTLMELYGFSQLPVMRGKRPVGVVSWESIGKALLRNPTAGLSDCIDRQVEIRKQGDDLLDSIASISARGYVLVENNNRSISGIITSADLGEALGDIAGPYLLLSEIEEILRDIVGALLATGDLTEVDIGNALADETKGFGGDPASLTLGELANVLATDVAWQALDTSYDRSTVNRTIGDVSKLRNQVMHFRVLDDADKDLSKRLPFVRDVLRNLSEEFGSIGPLGAVATYVSTTGVVEATVP